MGDLDDNQQARLFEALLSDAEQWHTPPRAQARRAAEKDDAVAEDLSLIVALRDVKPQRDEAEFARARIAQRLAMVMRAEPGPAPAAARPHGARAWLRALTAPPATSTRRVTASPASPTAQQGSVPGARWRPGEALGRLAMVAMALLTLGFGLLAGASVASAHALPESPFYGVKRAEESTLLALSWTDDSKGATLTMIANHRITEAGAEADLRRSAEARTLLGEFDTAFAQLIDLTAQAGSKHEDTTTLARAVQTTLETEQTIATQAETHGHATFAQAAKASAQAAAAHIQQAGIVLPDASGKNNSHGSSAGNNDANGKSGSSGSNGASGSSGKPQQTPGVEATHTPHTSAGNSAQGTPTVGAG